MTGRFSLPVTLSLVASLFCLATPPQASAGEAWDRAAAARYLDERAALWSEKAKAIRKLSTACLSCHTSIPYLLSRAALSDSYQDAPAESLFSDVEQRVANWSSSRVWYEEDLGQDKPDQSRATESILNAVALTSRDIRAGDPASDQTKAALANMWELQGSKGNWEWLHFDLIPWETDGSAYWGAALAAVASMSVADDLEPPSEGVQKLRGYLRGEMAAEANLHNHIALLWAASVWDGLLSKKETTSVVRDIVDRQQPDGGFLPRKSPPWWPAGVSDGYSTAFAAFVLQLVDDPRAAKSSERAIGWLENNQQPDGRWNAVSANKDRSGQPAFKRLLMSDAATGFAVLALTAPRARD